MRRILACFWNRDERRLRALWRLFVFGFLILTVGLAATLLVPVTPAGNYVTAVGLSVVATLLFLGGLWLAARFVDRRPLAGFGLELNRQWWLDLAFGLGLGALLMAFVFLVESLAGWVQITREAGGRSAARLLAAAVTHGVICVAVGLGEEAISRGYVLRNLAEGLNLRRFGPRSAVVFAWVGSSVMFGLYHGLNPGATPLSTLNLMLAGLFLGLPYVLTGSLAVPIGLHVTWNFFQGPVFGFSVSGLALRPSLLEVQQTGPDLLTGGAFGPEGGLVGVVATVLGALVVLWWIQNGRGELRLQTALAEPPATASTLAAEPAVQPESSNPV